MEFYHLLIGFGVIIYWFAGALMGAWLEADSQFTILEHPAERAFFVLLWPLYICAALLAFIFLYITEPRD